MTGDNAGPEGADPLSAPFRVLSTLVQSAGIAARPVAREPVHVWELSAVERIRLDDGTTFILKTADTPFTREAEVIVHASHHGVPVPTLRSVHRDPQGWLAMLMDDLGEMPEEDAPRDVGAQAAVQVHACPAMDGLPFLDAAALAALPGQALASLQQLRDTGRWTDNADVSALLEQLAEVGEQRARGTDVGPFGLCHSEFHPTSLHTGPKGTTILDWARAFNGPGLLDLASWEDTPKPLDTDALAAMIRAYVATGGTVSALANRGGLPAEVWAGGWHRVWISEWYLQQSLRWIPDPSRDTATQRTVRRHLEEAARCLTG
ncbi:aminoglycoside phosphotransferase family protein [Actinomadura darangshiensis]|uniref:aminoglycoside phosphotransferase family protein n=1 Tax=Actinomadura darangshiensis TaxID=705336 RepID=UPI001A9DF829|nr:aminoglycoside phosphotransferase family protein [Actinomadura darangshiensis]